MPYATHDLEFDRDFIEHEQRYSIDVDLCDLMQTMKLDVSCEKGKTAKDILLASQPNIQDDLMVLKCADSELSSSESSQEPSYGCAYLQAIRTQLEDYPTTGGEYLDVILTHREILHSYPAVHHDCARGFSDLACLLEKRPWRSDRDSDIEAVTAFRHEAWVIAASFLPPQAPGWNATQSKFICAIPMM